MVGYGRSNNHVPLFPPLRVVFFFAFASALISEGKWVSKKEEHAQLFHCLWDSIHRV